MTLTPLLAIALMLAVPLHADEPPIGEYDGEELYERGYVTTPITYWNKIRALAHETCRGLLADNAQHYREPGLHGEGAFAHQYATYCYFKEVAYLHDLLHRCTVWIHADGGFDSSIAPSVVDDPDVAVLYCADRRFAQYKRTGSYDPVPSESRSWEQEPR